MLDGLVSTHPKSTRQTHFWQRAEVIEYKFQRTPSLTTCFDTYSKSLGWYSQEYLRTSYDHC
jgi:hypothetical protein